MPAGGIKVDALAPDAMHTADIRRSGQPLTVIVDGKVASEVTLDPNRRFGLALAVPTGEATLDDLRLEEPRGNPLFNGKDLTGWHVNNDKGTGPSTTAISYRLRIAGCTICEPTRSMATSPGRSSTRSRAAATRAWPFAPPTTAGPRATAWNCRFSISRAKSKTRRWRSTAICRRSIGPTDPNEWNRVVVKADGRMISAWVNGELVQQVNTAWLPELKHRHLQGWIGVQDHGGKVRFRELYVHEAPDGMGLDAWYRPRSEPGSDIVLDRVMNSERLSRVDGLGSGVVSKTVPKGGEHVLADLTGPGALVRCWRSYAAGRLAFYFDGEEQPRIECDAEHLFDHVPGVADQEQPVLMCLPYAKSLKIVRDRSAAGHLSVGLRHVSRRRAGRKLFAQATGHPSRHAVGDQVSSRRAWPAANCARPRFTIASIPSRARSSPAPRCNWLRSMGPASSIGSSCVPPSRCWPTTICGSK